jgi:peptide chain release factor 1
MIKKELLEKTYNDLVEKLSLPNLKQEERVELQKKATHCGRLIGLYKEIDSLKRKLEKTMQESEDADDLKELYNEEIEEIKGQLVNVQQELDDYLYPPDKNDKRSVFLEIRSGTGGQEAALFAFDLFTMYTNYAQQKGWQISLVEENKTDIGGFSKVVLYIKGKNVYGHLKFESGVHRVQRVPKTEGSGRVHTSTVTVAVLPEAKDVEIDVNPNDLRIDVYRASGAGGQHVNTTDSAVRITHIPTGAVVTCQDERSQIKNKAKAMKVLKSRLLEGQRRKKEAERSAQRKQQVGAGERSEKVRTYNFPQNRVTDHRINLTLMKLDIVLQGNIDDIVDVLCQKERELRQKDISN